MEGGSVWSFAAADSLRLMGLVSNGCQPCSGWVPRMWWWDAHPGPAASPAASPYQSAGASGDSAGYSDGYSAGDSSGLKGSEPLHWG